MGRTQGMNSVCAWLHFCFVDYKRTWKPLFVRPLVYYCFEHSRSHWAAQTLTTPWPATRQHALTSQGLLEETAQDFLATLRNTGVVKHRCETNGALSKSFWDNQSVSILKKSLDACALETVQKLWHTWWQDMGTEHL